MRKPPSFPRACVASVAVTAALVLAGAASGQCEPEIVGSVDTPGDAEDIVLDGNLAYVADGLAGLRIYDISDDANPTLVGVFDTPGVASGVAVSGNVAHVADFGAGLHMIDVTDPANPVSLGVYDTPDSAVNVVVADGVAYVANQGPGLQVIDVSDPANPAFLGAYNTAGATVGIVVVDAVAYLADFIGLQIIDVTDPTNPAFLGFYDTPGTASGVAVVGDIAYVADRQSGLQIIDVSDSANPSLLGFYDTPELAYGVAVSGTVAYVADFAGGLRMIDVSDPSNPALRGFVDTPGTAVAVAVAGTVAYVTDGLAGLHVIDLAPCFPWQQFADDGECDIDNGLPNGIDGYGNGPQGVLAHRRALLDDFVVPAGTWCEPQALIRRHVWNSCRGTVLGPLVFAIWSDDNGAPGLRQTPDMTSFGAIDTLTGVEYFGNLEHESRYLINTDTVLGPGRYWLEALQGLGECTDNNRWLTTERNGTSECWVNYDDPGVGLSPGSEQFGVEADLSWAMKARAVNPFCLADDFDGSPQSQRISEIPGSGWQPWDGDPASHGGTVVSDPARSGPHAISVGRDEDIVRPIIGIASGSWEIVAHQYLPASAPVHTGFVLLNQYVSGASEPKNISTRVTMNQALGIVSDGDGNTPPLIEDAWVEIRVSVDLDANTQTIRYGDVVLSEKSWSEGLTGGGARWIAALELVDLGSPPSNGAFYDDITLCQFAGCPEDLDDSGAVDFGDILAILAAWGQSGVPEDLDASGAVGFSDLLLVLGAWGACG